MAERKIPESRRFLVVAANPASPALVVPIGAAATAAGALAEAAGKRRRLAPWTVTVVDAWSDYAVVEEAA